MYLFEYDYQYRRLGPGRRSCELRLRLIWKCHFLVRPDDLWVGSAEFTYEGGEGNYAEIFAYRYNSFRDYLPYP